MLMESLSILSYLGLHEYVLLDLFVLVSFLLRFNVDTGICSILSIHLGFKNKSMHPGNRRQIKTEDAFIIPESLRMPLPVSSPRENQLL